MTGITDNDMIIAGRCVSPSDVGSATTAKIVSIFCIMIYTLAKQLLTSSRYRLHLHQALLPRLLSVP